MLGHNHFTSKQNAATTSTSYVRFIVYYNMLYLLVAVVVAAVIAGTAVVVPIIIYQSDDAAIAGPGSVYIPGKLPKHFAYFFPNCFSRDSWTHLYSFFVQRE